MVRVTRINSAGPIFLIREELGVSHIYNVVTNTKIIQNETVRFGYCLKMECLVTVYYLSSYLSYGSSLLG